MKCQLCDVYMPAEFLSQCDVFPIDRACAACLSELRDDESDPVDHEAREECGQ